MERNIVLNTKFRLHNRSLVRRVQLDTVEDYVFERFGEMSYRIFRMLMDKGHLGKSGTASACCVVCGGGGDGGGGGGGCSCLC